jgi:hypothetical protein
MCPAPKARIRVVLFLLGMILEVVGLGAAVAKQRAVSSAYEQGRPAHADPAAGGLSGLAAWMIIGGGIALFGAVLLRDD